MSDRPRWTAFARLGCSAAVERLSSSSAVLSPPVLSQETVMVTAEFRSKPPHRDCWLRLHWEGPEPTALVDALEATGWRRCYRQPLARLPGQPDGRDFEKPRSGQLHDWTRAERKANLAQARRILRRHGLTQVP